MKYIALRRKYFALKHLRSGVGVEIGALTEPLSVGSGVQVRYLDRISNAELEKQYPEIDKRRLVPVDFVDDGESLSSIPADSLDFLIANHFLEHTINPLGTIFNFLRVLKSGGQIFMAIPDRRATFDRGRPLTSSDHLIEVFRAGNDSCVQSHYEEYARCVENLSGESLESRVLEFSKLNYKIHFHTFQTDNFIAAINYLVKANFPVQIVEVLETEFPVNEFIVVLKKVHRNNESRLQPHVPGQNGIQKVRILIEYVLVAAHVYCRRVYYSIRSKILPSN